MCDRPKWQWRRLYLTRLVKIRFVLWSVHCWRRHDVSEYSSQCWGTLVPTGTTRRNKCRQYSSCSRHRRRHHTGTDRSSRRTWLCSQRTRGTRPLSRLRARHHALIRRTSPGRTVSYAHLRQLLRLSSLQPSSSSHGRAGHSPACQPGSDMTPTNWEFHTFRLRITTTA